MALDDLYVGVATPSATALWQRAYLLDRLAADDLDGIKALAAATGGGADYEFDFLTESWPPSFVAFRQGDRYECCLQGTSNIRQVILHLSGTIDTEGVADSAFINKAWGGQATGLMNRFLAYLDGKPAPSRIVVSGHSYGAGVAQIIGTRVANRYGAGLIQVATYGSPRWGSGNGFATTAGMEVRCVADGDAVPRLPPRGAAIDLVGGARQLLYKQSVNILWRHRGQRVGLPKEGPIGIGGGDEEEAIGGVSFGVSDLAGAHAIREYRRRLAQSGNVAFPAGWIDRPSGRYEAPSPQQVMVPPVLPTDNVDIPHMNRVYYGTEAGPIGEANRQSFQSGGIAVGTPSLRFSTNIGSEGAPMADWSGVTKVSLIINNGINGHAESHVINIKGNDPNFGQAVGGLATVRAQLLGNAQTAPPYVVARNTPQIQYARITDARNPRLGYLIDWSKAQFFGTSSTSATNPENTAETMAKAVTLRLSGTSGNAPPVFRNTTCQLIAWPDNAVQGYDVLVTRTDPAGVAFGNALAAYWNHLAGLQPNGQPIPVITYKWGFMGAGNDINPTPPTAAMTISSIAYSVPPAAPRWIVTTAAAHGILAGDHVRIRGANSTFDGVWKVTPIDATTFTFAKGPVSGHTGTNGGVVYRIQSGGVSLSSFFAYNNRPQAFPPDNVGSVVCRASKHNPGKQWLPYTFFRRTRRER